MSRDCGAGARPGVFPKHQLRHSHETSPKSCVAPIVKVGTGLNHGGSCRNAVQSGLHREIALGAVVFFTVVDGLDFPFSLRSEVNTRK